MITLEQRLNVLNSAIRTFGKESQKVVTIEELAELQKELTKDLRGKPNLQKIAEEMADVEIMLEQLELIYGVGLIQQKQVFKENKLKRLVERINLENDRKGLL